MTWPIVDITFWNPGDGRTPAIDALLADPSTPLARHGLTGIAAAYARETGAFLHEVHRHWAEELGVRTLAVDGALTEVVPALQDAGIGFFVAKGPVIAYGQYPDPNMRPYCDLDIYVGSAGVEKARRILADMGYAPVHHAVGVLGGLAQEVHGGRFSAVVEVHAHPVDNLHRRHLPDVDTFLAYVEDVDLCGVKTPVLAPSAHLALQAIHLAAGHRYAKLVLLRDLDQAWTTFSGALGAGPYVDAIGGLLTGLGRGSRHAGQSGVVRGPLVRSLLRRDPKTWDEYALSGSNLLALLNQKTWPSAAWCAALASRSLIPSRDRRVSVRAAVREPARVVDGRVSP